MIKTFEGFKLRNNDNFEEVYRKFMDLLNNSVPSVCIRHYAIPLVDLSKIDKFINYDYGIPTLIDLSEIHREITQEDKNNIFMMYNELYKIYELDLLPDYEDIDSYFMTLYDMTEVEFSVFVADRYIRYIISLIPDVKIFPKRDKIQFNIDKYDEILLELVPTIKRLQDKYKVNTYIKEYGRMEVTIHKLD